VVNKLPAELLFYSYMLRNKTAW